MASEATYLNDSGALDYVTGTALTSGEILQMPDGRAGYVESLNGVAADRAANIRTSGRVTVTKTASLTILDGAKVYWDRSAGGATPLTISDGTQKGDFYIGVAVGDAAYADTTVVVDLNVPQVNLIELGKTDFVSVAVATSATVIPSIASTMASAYGGARPGSRGVACGFTANNEATKVDLLSVEAIPVDVPCIMEAEIAQVSTGPATLDVSVGLANATHATDADSITEFVGFHVDGTSANINAESRDGTSVAVTATDTTKDFSSTTSKLLTIDARDTSDVQLYVNAVPVLSAITFDISSATGPLKALFHMERSGTATAARYDVLSLAVRTFDKDEA